MKKNKLLTIIFLLAFGVLLSACGTRVMPSSWPGITVDGDTVYVAYNPHVYALRLDNGREIWRFPNEPDNSLTIFAAPVMTEDGQLLAGGYNHIFYSLDPDTGQENWRNEDMDNLWIGSPLVTEEGIYAPNGNHTLYALDFDGDIIWEYESGEPLWATPVTDGETLYLAAMDHNLYALPFGGGDPRWLVPLNGAMVNGPVLSPDGVLYVGSFGNEVVAVDSQTGKLLWEVPTEDWVWASPSLGEDVVYVADISGMLYALDATSGDEIWSLDAGSNITGSPLVHGDTIYIATEGGDVLAIDTTGRRMWTEAIGGRLLSSPVAADDLILIGIVEAESGAVIVALDLNGVQQWAFTPEN